MVVAILLVEVAGERYGVPVSVVEQILEIEAREIQHSQGQDMIAREGILLPMVRLRKLLGYESQAGPAPETPSLVVVAEMRGNLIGLVVDRFIGYREAVMKPLDKALRGVKGFAGVTVLGDGSMVLILDLNTL
jgi:two-component system chemotaxis sensor kinase CheA